MKAKVTTEFEGRPDDEILSRTIKVGETIIGDLAIVAVREEWAKEEIDPAPASPKSIEMMTLEELKAYAAEKQIALGQASKKAEVFAVIKAAEDASTQIPVEQMTEDQLKAYAAEKQIDISAAVDADAIRAALKAHADAAGGTE